MLYNNINNSSYTIKVSTTQPVAFISQNKANSSKVIIEANPLKKTNSTIIETNPIKKANDLFSNKMHVETASPTPNFNHQVTNTSYTNAAHRLSDNNSLGFPQVSSEKTKLRNKVGSGIQSLKDKVSKAENLQISTQPIDDIEDPPKDAPINKAELTELIQGQLQNISCLQATDNPNIQSFKNNPTENQTTQLDQTKSYAVIHNNELVALVFRKIMPQKMIESFKNTRFQYNWHPREAAGVLFTNYSESLMQTFNKLHGINMESCEAGMYIFPNANLSEVYDDNPNALKLTGETKKHVMYQLWVENKSIRSFEFITLDNAWSNSDTNLSMEQNVIFNSIPKYKEYGSFKVDKSTFYFQRNGSTILIGEIYSTSKNSIIVNQKKSIATYYGSKACNGNSGVSACKNKSKNNLKELKCTPVAFNDCKIIKEIRDLANLCIKNLDEQSNATPLLSQMLTDQKANARKLRAWCGPDGYFSSINVNFSTPNLPTTNFHKDKNVAENGLAGMFATGKEYSGGETIFPGLLVGNQVLALNIMEGDFTIFKSNKLEHGNLPVKQNFLDSLPQDSILSNCSHHPENRRSIVLYLNNDLNKCTHKHGDKVIESEPFLLKTQDAVLRKGHVQPVKKYIQLDIQANEQIAPAPLAMHEQLQASQPMSNSEMYVRENALQIGPSLNPLAPIKPQPNDVQGIQSNQKVFLNSQIQDICTKIQSLCNQITYAQDPTNLQGLFNELSVVQRQQNLMILNLQMTIPQGPTDFATNNNGNYAYPAHSSIYGNYYNYTNNDSNNPDNIYIESDPSKKRKSDAL